MLLDEIKKSASEKLGVVIASHRQIGEGFYARVYLAETESGDKIVVKVCRLPSMAEWEAKQLKELSRHALVHVPRVFYIARLPGEDGGDAIFMEYIDGVNAGYLGAAPEDRLEGIGGEIVRNLVAWHSVGNPAGFGELDGATFAPDFRDVYRPEAASICREAEELFRRGELGQGEFRVVERAMERFDDVFCLPITRSALIHGDYNTWNVLLDPGVRHVVGVIDPFHCRWADPELDLYQLDNANGQAFRLMEQYRERRELSPNFGGKRRFYELFSEIHHYYYAGKPVSGSKIPAQAHALGEVLRAL